MYVLWSRRKGNTSTWYGLHFGRDCNALMYSRFLMAITCVMFVLALVHIALVLRAGLEGFIWGRGPNGSAIAYFADFTQRPYRLKQIIYLCTVSDIYLVHSH